MSYLGTSVMKATSSTMALASSVLGFDIVELWTQADDGPLRCTYVHATESIKKRHPDIITGHYPEHKKEHKLSPILCKLARESPNKYQWTISSQTVVKDGKIDASKSTAPLASLSIASHQVSVPYRTEMAYLLDDNGQTEGLQVYIVAFALDVIQYKPSKLKFLSGLGYAIYVAAFVLDEDEETESDLKQNDRASELDNKEVFLPRPLGNSKSVVSMAHSSSASLARTDDTVDAPPAASMGVWTPKPSRVSKIVINEDFPRSQPTKSKKDVDLGLSIDSPTKDAAGTAEMAATVSSAVPSALVRSNSRNREISIGNPPTWEPVDSFSFPVADISIKSFVPDNLTFHNFEDLRHIADGSNANIFLGKYEGFKVIVKMIKEDVQTSPVAVHEFDVEHGMLCRFSHPHIIRLLGAGLMPRRFIVLEYLGGGSLNTVLENNKEKPGLAQRFFRKPSFTYLNILSRARDMADALDYLHSRCQDGAVIIHRDLKPDNVGFTSDGTLKLFDFGLCTVVKSHERSDEVYEMTGNTGSLRYMAPEVAMRKPYNEKVDVYSFGIMVWQMARDKVPFKGMAKTEFYSSVVNGDTRPPLDKAWPSRFSHLLTSCWHSDYNMRPSFRIIVEELDQLYLDARGKATPPSTPPLIGDKNTPRLSGAIPSKDRKSSWF